MKVTLYGSHMCPDALYAIVTLKGLGVELTFKDISGAMPILKEFLAIRDGNPMFDGVREKKGVGIPLFILEDGTMTLDSAAVIEMAKAAAKA